jgi:hypothetical protein
MIDAVSVVVGSVIGAVFTASLYELSIRKKVMRMIAIMKRADQVQKDLDILAEKINNKKGGKDK